MFLYITLLIQVTESLFTVMVLCTGYKQVPLKIAINQAHRI